LGVDNVPSLRVKWIVKFKTPIYSSPAVVNGMVYVGLEGGSANLYALNAKTGTKRWGYRCGRIGSSPAVAKGIVYFGSYGDYQIHAVEAGTGTGLWSYGTGAYAD